MAWKESGHNPDKMLGELPRELLERAGADAGYLRRYDLVMDQFRGIMQKKACRLLAPFSPDHKLERLKKHFKDRWRPSQIIFAGKAHPADDPGKVVLQNLINLSRDPRIGGRVVFVEDYGEQLAQYLVHGVDVWLNTPLPPLEACEASGMKAALN